MRSAPTLRGARPRAPKDVVLTSNTVDGVAFEAAVLELFDEQQESIAEPQRAARSSDQAGRDGTFRAPPSTTSSQHTGGEASTDMDRRDLVERARRGDHDAFAQLVAADLGRLYAVARLMLAGTEPARDAVQDALLEAWRNLPSLRDASKYDAWVYRILVRSCSRQRGKQAATDLGSAPDLASDAELDSVVDREQLERGFRRLPAEQRAIVVLRFYLDLSLAEIADSLGLPEGTVKSRLHRGLAALRAALEADARKPHRLPEGSIQ